MTTDKTPTDNEIMEAIQHLGAAMLSPIEVARAVLAKWGSPVVAVEPLFWYRPVCGGDMYEGPVHANSVGGKMLREEKPGEWKPLFTTPPPTQAQAGAADETALIRQLVEALEGAERDNHVEGVSAYRAPIITAARARLKEAP